ncbi:twin-arginine translocation pathway signal protein [Amycolatopsis antarctica]|uniref:Twin-arginine translocation pathway signal protein n=1 Tax=Amycolatopsis antarctica TaxID=1854586 RepID=A0A263CYD7_9PSEU|nr:cobalamin-dependent protein [Amycolatopsis antarctica]OZM70115.1 twin-arginine translocation pathway signal protein [Amycolatopsis antarctica]
MAGVRIGERSFAGELAEFEVALAGPDTVRAITVVERLLADGVDPVLIMEEIVSAAQRRIGERWQRGEWSVAQEHAATGVSMAATEAVGRFAASVPVTEGRIVLGCAEREWHALPAMVVSHGLRSRGWDVTYLGAATPPARLSTYLQEIGPDAAAVSCSVLRALPSSRNFVEASTSAGIPVVAGGSAFGVDDTRAMALGATAWASTAFAAIEVIPALPSVVPPARPLPAEPLAEQRTLELNHDWLATTLRERWRVADWPRSDLRPDPDDLDTVVRDAVDQVLYALQGALVTGDHRIVGDTAWWIAELLRGRGLPDGPLAGLGELLAAELHEYPLAAALIRGHWRIPEPMGS